MILIINICTHGMHHNEFVKPIEDVLRHEETFFVTKHYSEIVRKDVDDAHRIIITGTSLQDFQYSKDIDMFKILKGLDKPILGICGGMQVLCMLNGCTLSKGEEIGLMPIHFSQEFLGLKGQREGYCLHNMIVKNDSALKNNFVIYGSSGSKKFVQAVKHKKLPYYGALFHPEVRNKDLIVKFLYV